MNKIPVMVINEITRLSEEYRSLYDLYSADVEWLINGTQWLNGDDLKLANWFNANTVLFEKEFLNRISNQKPN
ncbi:hypothetical protein FQS90_12395 [Enterococcus casseliflavus]|nr:hypothetical protein [Enterococcus casseliflavus]MBO1144444.1 hypothetical protein [Enterococcus casseliflavus]